MELIKKCENCGKEYPEEYFGKSGNCKKCQDNFDRNYKIKSVSYYINRKPFKEDFNNINSDGVYC